MGALIAVVILGSRAVSPMGQAASLITNYEDASNAYNMLNDMMQKEVERPSDKNLVSHNGFNGKIEFRNVSFAYPNTDVEVLKNVSFVINPGEQVAILGKIGSGKSTLLKMIMNLYEPTKGSVLIDGLDTRQIDPVDLRHAIGCVPQEPFLFMGTIKDNLTIGEQYVSDEELVRVSKIAGLDDFLGKHEAGYDLMVGERGEGLSGGERQAVTLARALISDPDIIMLDEPTNSRDRQTERMFNKRMEDIVQNKTLIVVTHKTSLLHLVDRVIIVEDGQVIVDGPKEEVFSTQAGNK